MFDYTRQILDGIISEMSLELGAGWQEIPYITNVEKNNLRQSSMRYGAKPGPAFQLDGVTKHITYSQTFEMVLTKAFVEAKINDSKAIDKGLDLSTEMLCIHKRLINTKAGVPSLVMNIVNITLEDPEYLEDDKVTVLRSNIDVIYRISLI